MYQVQAPTTSFAIFGHLSRVKAFLWNILVRVENALNAGIHRSAEARPWALENYKIVYNHVNLGLSAAAAAAATVGAVE